VSLALHRSDGDKPGPIVAHLLAPNQISGTGTLIMRGRDRDELVAGKLFVDFYSRQQPLGTGRRKVELR
jgi:amidase